MAGKIKGVQKLIMDQYPKAVYIRCMAHAVSLAISKSVSVKPIQDLVAILQDIGKYFNSAKRNAVLTNQLVQYNERKRSVKTVCLTRWTELYTSINQLLELFVLHQHLLLLYLLKQEKFHYQQ